MSAELHALILHSEPLVNLKKKPKWTLLRWVVIILPSIIHIQLEAIKPGELNNKCIICKTENSTDPMLDLMEIHDQLHSSHP